eukprot:356834-Prorocentrum_minimum.AAC.3
MEAVAADILCPHVFFVFGKAPSQSPRRVAPRARCPPPCDPRACLAPAPTQTRSGYVLTTDQSDAGSA